MSEQPQLVPPPTDSISEVEMQETLSGPAFHSNRMFVSNLAGGVRITFAEQLPQMATRFRTAVVLSYPDAISLRDLLNQQLREAEEMMREAHAASSGSGDGR